MALKENYKDDILDTSQNVKRKYQMENNGDGTVSFTDVTEYTQQGDSFGSGDINATNGKVNTLDANLDGFKFYPSGTDIVGLISDDSAYTDEDGNYVIWGTDTAEQLVEDNPNTYKAVASEEDTRGKEGEDTAVSFGGSNMEYLVSGASFLSLDTSTGSAVQYAKNIGDSKTADITLVKDRLLNNYARHTLTCNVAKKIKLSLNYEISITQARSQTIAVNIKHNNNTVFTDSISARVDTKIENEILELNCNQNDTVTIELTMTSAAYSYGLLNYVVY